MSSKYTLKDLQYQQIAMIYHGLREYGGSYTLKDNVLTIKNQYDVFFINLTDKKRFGYYTLFHRNTNTNLNGKVYSHVQGRFKYLEPALFTCFTHGFNKDIGIDYSKEDYRAFKDDALKYYLLGFKN